MPRRWNRYSRILLNSFRHRIFPHLWAYYLRSGKSFYPRRLNLELTYQCNLRCKMCLLHRAGHLNKRKDELRLSEIADLMRAIRRWRPSIGLSGGEPFLRQDILEIIAVIKKESLACDLITNGTLMDEHHCVELVNLGLEAICFSLDGMGGIHDCIRGRKDSYQKAVKAMDCLNKTKKRRGARTPNIFINCVMTRDNIPYLEKMVEVASELNVGLQYTHVMFLEPEEISRHRRAIGKDFPDKSDEFLEGLAHNQGELDSRFLAEKVKEVRQRAAKLNQAVKFSPDLSGPEIINYYSASNWWSSSWCFSPWLFVTISPDGDVYPCLQLKMGNIREKGLEEIWNGNVFQRFRNKIKRSLYPRCQRCCHLGAV